MFEGYKYDKDRLKELVREGMSAYKLSQLIGKDPSTIPKWLERNPDKTIDDYIDMITSIETKSYKGYTWTSIYSLAKQLGVGVSAIYKYLNDNPDKTEMDYIDIKLEKIDNYRGYKWKSYADLSIQLKKDKK